MDLTDIEIKTLVSSLIFAAVTDACLNTNTFNPTVALELAEKFNDPKLELDCYLYKGGVSNEYYEELSYNVEHRIPQIKIETIDDPI